MLARFFGAGIIGWLLASFVGCFVRVQGLYSGQPKSLYSPFNAFAHEGVIVGILAGLAATFLGGESGRATQRQQENLKSRTPKLQQTSPEPLKTHPIEKPRPSPEEELKQELERRKEKCKLLAARAFEVARELGRETEKEPPEMYRDDSRPMNGGFWHDELLGGYEFTSDLLNIVAFGAGWWVEWDSECARQNEWEVKEVRPGQSYYVNVFSGGKQVLSTWGEDLYLPGKWEDSLATLLSNARHHRWDVETQAAAEKERNEVERAARERQRFGL